MYQSEWYEYLPFLQLLISPGRNLFADVLDPFVLPLPPVPNHFLKSSAPKWIRGAVVACYQWAITIGLLIASVVSNGVQNIESHKSYRIAIALQFIWAFILAVGMAMLPESPRYLVRKGKDEKAAKALAKLLSTNPADRLVTEELDDIRANLTMERELEQQIGGNGFGSGYRACFKTENHILLRTLTGIFLQAWQQLTGIKYASVFQSYLR